MEQIKAKIKVRRGSYDLWYSANPVLEDGELSLVTSGPNAGSVKAGDGSTPWADLPFLLGGSSGGGASDYNDLSNKPQIGGVTLSGNKSASALGLATPAQVTAEQTRASQAESDLDSAKLAKSFAQNVVTDIGVGHDASQPDRLYAKVTRRNPSTGADAVSYADIPLADSANSGLMAHQDVQTLAAHGRQIAALQGSIVPRGTITQATADVTAAILNAFIQTTYSRSPQAGDAVKDGSGVTWVYTASGWIQWGGGSGDIGQFSQGVPGTITGSEQDGQVYGENDGTGSVAGWDSLKSRVANLEEGGAGMSTLEYESREAAEDDWKNIPLGARVVYPEEEEEAALYAVITASASNISLPVGKYKITLVGGGSSGARGAANYGGPGGGGGAAVIAYIKVLEKVTASCVIGAAAAAGSSSTANTAGNASSLAIGSLVLTASGGGNIAANGTNYYSGAPGGDGSVSGSNAGLTVTASLILPGQDGESNAPAGSSAYGRGGRGGSSSLGQGGRGGHNGTTKTGGNGKNYGGAGGGGYGANNGGSGAQGVLIIEAL
jgi:hypothetical protein